MEGNQAYLEWMGKSGSFQIEARLLGMRSSFKGRRPPLEGNGNVGIPFTTKQKNRPSSRVEEGSNEALLELWCETRCILEWGQESQQSA